MTDGRISVVKWPDRKNAALCIHMAGHGYSVMVPLLWFAKAKHTEQWVVDDLIKHMQIHVPEALRDRIADAITQDVEAAQ